MSDEFETYSLRLVTEFLQKEGIPFEHSSARLRNSFYEHGCRIVLNDTFKLSIQTHPDVVGTSFAETALQNMVDMKICYDGTLGYYDVRHWNTPQHLFEHIKTVLQQAKK